MILGPRKMGYGSWILHLVLLLIFTLMSFHYTHFLIMGDSFNAVKFFNTHDLQQVHGGRRENHIEKVSGEVGKQENEPLFLEKFRTLLGVKFFKFNQKRRLFDGDVQYGSPSPSPLPSIETPAPAPVHPVHLHSHAPWRRHRWIPSPPKIHKEERDDNGRTKTILVAVLVSAGATSILSLVGLFWGCRKFRKQRKRSSTSTVAMYRSEGGGARSKSKYLNSQNSVKKVTSDPGPDLFYLESLGTALEPHSLCLKQSTETVNKSLNQNTLWALNEVEPKKKESMKIELEEGSSSAVGEIVSVHDSVESVKYEAVNSSSPSREKIIPVESHYSSDDESIKYEGLEKVIPVEDHESFDDESIKNDVDIIIPVEAHYSSDDESFHSFCNSHSSDPRLSNASIGSLSDKSEIVSPNLSKASPFSAPPPVKLAIPSPSPVPPPPPPPPLPCVQISPSYSTSSSTRIKYKASSFSALPNLSLSPRNSDSSSGSNQTPKSDLPLSPPNPQGPPMEIPPPPLPPPFTKGSLNSLKGPPPPPSLFPQHTPLGKDGSPLPKLKPLHWDKVRAASDRSMVWDKLKSSSFEFDEQMIESLFGYNLPNSMKNEEAKSKSPSPSKHVLEPKRLQNITILSKALNVTAEQVCHALRVLDAKL